MKEIVYEETLREGIFKRKLSNGNYAYYKLCECSKFISTKSNTCAECLIEKRHGNLRNMTIRQCQEKLSVAGKHQSWKNSEIRGFCRSWNKHLKNHACQNCGYSKHIEFCHTKPLKDFDIDTKISEVNCDLNILVLCPNCHWEFDNKLLKLEDIPERTQTEEPEFRIKIEGYINSSGHVYGANPIIKRDPKDWPSDDELYRMVWDMPLSQIAEILNRTSESISKRCDKNGVKRPGPQYWRIKILSSMAGIPTKRTKINWPTVEEVAKMVWEMSTVKISEKLGVSDKAVEKFCKKNGISKPPRGYWAKQKAKGL